MTLWPNKSGMFGYLCASYGNLASGQSIDRPRKKDIENSKFGNCRGFTFHMLLFIIVVLRVLYSYIIVILIDVCIIT